jgi:hypothetical protein
MSLLARAASACAAFALLASTWTAAAIAQELPSDADTPTNSPSAWDGVWPWLLLGAGIFLLLVLVAVGVGWRSRRASGAAPAEARQLSPPPPRSHAGTWDIAVLTFPRTVGAEHGFADVRDDLGQRPWLREVAFVERHRHGRIIVRGTFAGRYVDVDGTSDELARLSQPHGGLLDEIGADVPEGSSALVIFAPTDDVDAMAEAFRDSEGRLTRRRVSAETAAALEASVATAPPAAPAPGVQPERTRP